MSDFALPKPRATGDAPTFRTALKRQQQVLFALMLHDIKSRFFGNGLGYIATILWPASHMAVVILAFVFTGRKAVYGHSALLFAATGVTPYIAWSYISRFMILSVVQNKSFMSYPSIKPLDIMFARAFLEVVSIYIITVLLVVVLVVFQAPYVPIDISTSMMGLLSAVLLGIGFGTLNSVISMMLPLWGIVYILILIVGWLTAGLAIDIEALPKQLGDLLAWNPLLHSVEWVRLGYYPDFPAYHLSKSYVLFCGAGSFVLGLVAERALRRFLL